MEDFLQKLRFLIQQSNTKDALQKCLNFIRNRDARLHDEVTLLLSQYTEIRKNRNYGLLKNGPYLSECTRINSALLQIINEIELTYIDSDEFENNHELITIEEPDKKMVLHNLPNQPYKLFFGREDSINKIRDELLDGRTYIASIDGVGGIGKTALAYYFCKEVILEEGRFDYLIWLTAKDTVFDPFSEEGKIKTVENEFKNNSVETLINETIKVLGFFDLVGDDMEKKKEFFEEVVRTEKIFFVFDNLETIQDDRFFDFIKQFNKLSKNNSDLKILTTSRRRKKIADFPIEIEGLYIRDALQMLYFLAKNVVEKPINDILNAREHDNIILIERVGRIPLAIEFIVGQMAKGKSRGQIIRELEEYPTLENTSGDVRRQRLADIIMFSFKDMYESLDSEHQLVYKTIAALQKNIRKNEKNISFELLMNIRNLSQNKLSEILENLIENQLIIQLPNSEYTISKMSINFAKQYFEDFYEFEEKTVNTKERIVKSNFESDNVVIFIEHVKNLVNDLEYAEAEKLLQNAIERIEDARLYFELAEVQNALKKFNKATENYRKATELSPANKNMWYRWVDFERNNRPAIALYIAQNALENTDYDYSITSQILGIYKYKKEYENMRSESDKFLNIYLNKKRDTDYIKLLNFLKGIEFVLFKETNSPESISKILEKLLEIETDSEKRLELLKTQLYVAKKTKKNLIPGIQEKINQIESVLKSSIPRMVKQMNSCYSRGDWANAKSEANKILTYANKNFDKEYIIQALRALLQILTSEKDYDKVVTYFEKYRIFINNDEACLNAFNKASKVRNKELIISDIRKNIATIDKHIKSFLWNIFIADEKKFKDLVNSININWLKNWEYTRNKSLNNETPLLYYSDLSNIHDIINHIISDQQLIESINGFTKEDFIQLRLNIVKTGNLVKPDLIMTDMDIDKLDIIYLESDKILSDMNKFI